MFVRNNRASFYLLWKENLLKHQKVSKYYESGCRVFDTSYIINIHKYSMKKHNTE